MYFRVVAFVLLGASAGFSGSVPKRVFHQPTPVPDRIILTWSGDPATTQSVTWRTDASVKRARAEIAVAEDGPKFTREKRTVEATTVPFESNLGEARMHTATFTGLEPDTLYAYRVGDGDNWSEWFQFRTASREPKPLAFLFFGDAQTHVLEHWSRVVRAGFQMAPDAKFMLHTGDLVNNGHKDELWGEWFKAAGWIDATIPSILTPGNHEYGFIFNKGLPRQWQAQFELPRNGPPGLEETCYYIDVQGVRVIALNSNEKRQEQAAWLEQVLSNNPNRWTVVAFHHPVYSAAKLRNNEELRELWQPIFDKYGVDLVLNGHDHTYARTNLVTGAGARLPGRTMYVLSVSGPKMYRGKTADWMRKSGSGVQLVQIIRIDGDRLTYEARTVTGRLFDAFELRKREGMANLLVNRVPGEEVEQAETESPVPACVGGGALEAPAAR